MYIMNESETTHELTEFLQLLSLDDQAIDESEVNNTPVFTEAVRQSALAGEAKDGSGLTQYGLLGADVPKLRGYKVVDGAPSQQAPFIYYNIKAPSSVFICGSQGSGKSHTLSCLLENFLIPSQANRLPEPLTGIVFHFDPFLSEDRGNPCEAAYLSSHPQVKVRVLCPPTNVGPIKVCSLYSVWTHFDANVCRSFSARNRGRIKGFQMLTFRSSAWVKDLSRQGECLISWPSVPALTEVCLYIAKS